MLRMSLDETSVSTMYSGQRGAVLRLWPGTRARARAYAQATRAQLRASFTHVAIICDSPHIQPVLPQLIICGENVLSKREQALLEPRLPRNVFLVRQKKGWNTTQLMVRIIKILGRLLAPHLGGLQPVLSMDCAKIHLHRSVVRACASAGIWYCLVPAKLTWLLQPCDTHLFARYKRHLKAAFYEHMADAGPSAATAASMVMAVCQTIREVMQGCKWASAFDATGCSSSQDQVQDTILRELQWAALPEILSTQPLLGDLTHIFPARYHIPYKWLWAACNSSLVTAAGDVAMDSSPEEGDGPEDARPLWFGRTRSTSSLLTVSVPAAAPSVAPPAATSATLPAPDRGEPPPNSPWSLQSSQTASFPTATLPRRAPVGTRLPGRRSRGWLPTPGTSSTQPWQPQPPRGSAGSQAASPT